MGQAEGENVVCIHGKTSAVNEGSDEIGRFGAIWTEEVGGCREWDVDYSCFFGCEVVVRKAGFVAKGVDFGLAAAGLKGRVVEEEGGGGEG